MRNRHIAFGAVFGFVLSRVGATDYDAIRGMFLLTDLHLVGVIVGAIAVAGAGFAAMRARRVRARGGLPLALARKPMTRGVWAGGLLFGAGWALAGTCPGTALAQLGEGTLAGGLTLAGILIGADLHARIRARAVRGAPCAVSVDRTPGPPALPGTPVADRPAAAG